MAYDEFTALVVVDVQNDFADPSGSLFVPGGDEAIEFINAEIADAAGQGALLVYTQDWHPESTPHFEKDGGIWPVHCVGGTWGAEFHPELHVVDGALFIKKGQGGEDGYSAFGMRDPITGEESSTGLADHLRRRGIEKVVVVGLALDYCVKGSALDARTAGFGTVLLADGTRAVDLAPGDGVRAAAALATAGIEVV
jgi:nicotinamidase/pyrazinamidase